MTDISPAPWAVRCTDTPTGTSVAIIDRAGGVVALVKNGSGRKMANALAITQAVNEEALRPRPPSDFLEARRPGACLP